MKKKIISLCLVVALVAIAVIGGTLAYFTDTDSETNTFTVGNVDIEIAETFTPNSKLYPSVPVEKKVAVEVETGSEEAWVWVTYTIPTNFYNMIDLTWSDSKNWTEASTAVDGDNTVVTCKYTQKVAADAKTDLNLTAVTLKAGVTTDGSKLQLAGKPDYTIPTDKKLPIVVNAYGFQTTGVASVDVAYNQYNNITNP